MYLWACSKILCFVSLARHNHKSLPHHLQKIQQCVLYDNCGNTGCRIFKGGCKIRILVQKDLKLKVIKKCAPKLVFFNEKKNWERLRWFLKKKIDFESQILAPPHYTNSQISIILGKNLSNFLSPNSNFITGITIYVFFWLKWLACLIQ